jgi:dUTP pyrophosphatase
MQVKIKKTHPLAKTPTYGTTGAACFDLYACEDALCPAGGSVVVEIGVAFEVPAGHVLLIHSRSGHGFKSGVRLVNACGVIDSDYRDAVKVGLHSDRAAFEVKAGDRVAQAMVIPYPRVEFIDAEDLSETARGLGGFGSTGR